MKKTILIITTLCSSLASYAQCNELFFSEYVEGAGNDKALEVYNPTNSSINLSGYTIERHSNGASDAGTGGTLTLAGTIAPHDVWVIVNGQTVDQTNSPKCDPALQALADQLDVPYPAPTYMNGNDAILLKKNGAMIDIIGKSGDAAMTSSESWSDLPPYDGSAGAGTWWTKDHTLIRKASVMSGVTVNPSQFIVINEWDSLPKGTWTNLGSHTCNCPVGISDAAAAPSTIVYPSQLGDHQLHVVSKSPIRLVTIYSILGQTMSSMTNTETDSSVIIYTGELTKGVYLVKVDYLDSKSSVIKVPIVY